MSRSQDIQRVARELGNERTLSVYVDAPVTDPSISKPWRPARAAALHAERERLSDAEERMAFDRAASFVEEGRLPLGSSRGEAGWMAFVTPEGPQYAERLPVHVPTLALWREGAVVSPYQRALDQQRSLRARSPSARVAIAKRRKPVAERVTRTLGHD
jgi:hypothetical protein